MKVFVVLSEMFESGGNVYGDPPEPPDYGRIAAIVAAKTHSRARYLALKAEHLTQFGLLDWPRCTVRLLTSAIVDEGVVQGQMADHFWRLVPETLRGPDEAHEAQTEGEEAEARGAGERSGWASIQGDHQLR